jgi:hypothetical protein
VGRVEAGLIRSVSSVAYVQQVKSAFPDRLGLYNALLVEVFLEIQ